jgi:hypothetical protein
MVAFPLFLHMIILYRDQQRSGNVFMEKIYRGYPLEVKRGYGIFNPERTCSSDPGGGGMRSSGIPWKSHV